MRTLIRTKRLLKGWSQDTMAIELGMSQSAYANLERGTTCISIDKMISIIKILDISPDEFYGIIED